jgi:hypothetical protein
MNQQEIINKTPDFRSFCICEVCKPFVYKGYKNLGTTLRGLATNCVKCMHIGLQGFDYVTFFLII